MIESIRIRNFKCIKNLDLDLAPLTILIGENGSGKSSILEAIAVMNQSLDKSIDDGLRKGVIEFEEPKNAIQTQCYATIKNGSSTISILL